MSRIQQCYISKSVADFPFREKLGLTEYIDSSRPCLFIGCYTEYDLKTILDHQSEATVLWGGQDALNCILNGWHKWLKYCNHTTFLTNVHKALKPFLNIQLDRPLLLGGDFNVTPKGNKVFAYAPATAPSYHRLDTIEILKMKVPFEFIIGDGTVPQEEWLRGEGNKVYDECFIGLCLSGFAGGGQTIIQMGLKGRKVITNVLDLPNTIGWKTIDFITEAILNESRRIGTTDTDLADKVKKSLR